MTATLQVEELHVTITYKAMKNIRLRVCSPDGDVRVSAPRYIPSDVLKQFIHARLDWIRKHRQQILNRPVLPSWQRIEDKLELHYRQQLLEQLPPLIARYEKALQVTVKGFRLRHMKTRWGSCNTRMQRVCFNLELARYAPEALEYVVAHELVHLRVASHSRRFYELLEQVMPDWRVRKLMLR